MAYSPGLSSIKIIELEIELERLMKRMRICQSGDADKIHQSYQQIIEECQKNDRDLQKRIEGCRSPAVAELSKAQLTYCKSTEQLLSEKLSVFLHSSETTPTEDRLEALALYAEYAVDFAVQAVRHAQLASLASASAELNQLKPDES